MRKLKILKSNIMALKNCCSKKIYLNNMPTYFWLEPTNHCNLSCIMCPNGNGGIKTEKGYMEYSLYKKIIDQIYNYTSAVTLAVGGESLLHPRFFDMVSYANGKGIKVILNTNATLLDKDKALQMLKSGISSISFAFDGFNKSMYEQARRGANFESTLDNILYFLRLKKKMGMKLPYTVLSILMLELESVSTEDKHAFLKQFTGLVDEVRQREVSTWGSAFKGTKDFSFRDNAVHYPPCSRLWSTAVIAWNGDVLTCVYDTNHEHVLGNVKEKTFPEIWNGEKMTALRKSMVEKTYLKVSPLCENCIVLGTSPIIGIPSGIRLSLSDSMNNIFGYGFEKMALAIANKLSGEGFTSRTIK